MPRIVVLSGAGLSAPSGVPTFRDADGLWEGHRVEDVATPEAWARDPATVRRFYDERRLAGAAVRPNAGHRALVGLQAALGADRVALVTQNIDGLFQRAAAELGAPLDLVEMHGSLWHLRCERVEAHPWVGVEGRQDPALACACGAALRPAVVWFGEMPIALDRIFDAVRRCEVFVSVGTSGLVYPAAGLVDLARRAGATTVEVNPRPSGARFDEVLAGSADVVLPELVARWA